MPSEDIKKIHLCAVPNGWAKQSYLQGWALDMKIYKYICSMFDQMEISEQVYKGGTPSKKFIEEYANRANHVRKRKIGEAILTANNEKCRSIEIKTKHSGHLINLPTSAKKTCLLHGPGHSPEECNLLKSCSEMYAAQRSHKDK